MARPYNKQSSYWNTPRKPQVQPITINTTPASAPIKSTPFPELSYGATEIATAGAMPSLNIATRGAQTNNGTTDPAAFQNIRAMPLAWEPGFGGNRSYVGMAGAIDLAGRAYFGVGVVRNAVEVAVEFSNQPIHIKTSNESVKTFFTEWLRAIQINKLKEEFFREYYRSGNVFLYKFSGKFGPAYYKNYQRSFGMKENKLPIRYSLLNPSSIFIPNGLSYPYTYTRLLSTYEIERLRNPLNDQDKQVFDSLPADVKKQLKAGGNFTNGLYIPLDPTRLRFSFYKKQGYEPMAVPMIFPVLPDIEWKLALKKMDMALARTIEHAILLVTTGETATQYNGGNGINQNNITRLQALFTNQTVGRVLVADYTTKAEWLIPDIKEILGPEKYQIVNDDIKEGLQSILTGHDKFANAQMKAKIFIQRLEEGQNAFLHEFLLPEIEWIANNMGFRTVPTVAFQKIDLQDETVMARIYAQLGQLGILTAEQVVEAIENNVLPDADEMAAAQITYKKDRDAGKYYPLIGASVPEDVASVIPAPAGSGGGKGGPTGRPAGTGVKKSVKSVGPVGTSRGSESISVRAYTEHLKDAQELVNTVGATLSKKFKVKELNAEQISVAQILARNIMAIYPREKWMDSIAGCIKNPPEMPKEIADEIDEIAIKYDVDSWDATILKYCRRPAPLES